MRLAHFLKPQNAILLVKVRLSNRIVVFTGAGISTSCGIPDFRGPAGIWTLQRARKPIPAFKTSFGIAKPSLTHQVDCYFTAHAVDHEACAVACVLRRLTPGLRAMTGSGSPAQHRQAEVHCVTKCGWVTSALWHPSKPSGRAAW